LHYEKNISTKQNKARQNTWVFEADVDKTGQKDY